MKYTSFQFPPWQIYERDNKGKVVRHTGLVLELAKELGNRLNFRFIHKLSIKLFNFSKTLAYSKTKVSF